MLHVEDLPNILRNDLSFKVCHIHLFVVSQIRFIREKLKLKFSLNSARNYHFYYTATSFSYILTFSMEMLLFDVVRDIVK